jgi:uncharacterized membrane protein
MSSLVRPEVMLAIAVMTAVTVTMRLGGFFLMRYVPVTPRVRRMLDALPGSVIMAAVLPVVAEGGLVAALAVLTGMAAMVVVRNDLAAVIVGVGVAALMRAAGLA